MQHSNMYCSSLIFIYLFFLLIPCQSTNQDDVILMEYGSSNFNELDLDYNTIVGSIDQCEYNKVKLNEIYSLFHFQKGYNDSLSTGNRNITTFMKSIEKSSAFLCDHLEQLLTYHQLSTRKDNEVFKVTKFLSLLENRVLGIIGDSFAMQLFQSLDVEIEPLWTRRMNGNGTHYSDERTIGKTNQEIEHYGLSTAAYRYYEPLNVTILFCKDHIMNIDTLNRQVNTFCSYNTIASDIVIISIGTHYKLNQPKLKHPSLDKYYEMSLKTSIKLEKALHTIRTYTSKYYQLRTNQKNNNKQQIIWRLLSHIQPIDEYKQIYRMRKENDRYNISKIIENAQYSSISDFHDSIDRECNWINLFNAVIKSISQLYHDYTLDHYILAKELFRHENDRIELMNHVPSFDRRISIHRDNLHMCAGGLFRASNLILLKQIEQHVKCILSVK